MLLIVTDAGGTASLTGLLGHHLGTEFAGGFLLYTISDGRPHWLQPDVSAAKLRVSKLT